MELEQFQAQSDPTGWMEQISQSTGDYYYFYDFSTGLVHFTRNALKATHIFQLEKPVCTLEQWCEHVDDRDVSRLKRVVEDLLNGRLKSYSFNYRVKNCCGESVWINSRGKAFQNEKGKIAYALGRLSSGAAREEERFNSQKLREELEGYLTQAHPGFLLLIGVDNLRTLNLKNGRDFGDALLRDVKFILQDEVPEGCEVYRISGDWFAVNLPDLTAVKVSRIFAKARERLRGQCTISAGCVSFTDYHVDDKDTLLQYVEFSLEDAKNHGKDRMSFFSPENYEEQLRSLELKEELRRCIDEGFTGFSLEYQPQLGLGDCTVYGAEALLRFTSPRKGRVSPAEFIPLLEQNGLICEVGLWVLKETLQACKKWREVMPGLHVSVNMSYVQLTQESIEEDVLEVLRSSGLPGDALTIEVTESMQLQDYPYLNKIFHRWKEAGIEISVDDFGTGYSSLGRLKNMEVDEIKVDRSFVTNIQRSAYNYRLLSNIIELANGSQIRVCCEGVETVEELEVLRKLKPELVQGFLLAKPCPEDKFAEACIRIRNLDLKKEPELPARQRTEAGAGEELAGVQDDVAEIILNAENDVFYLSDLTSYELYYLNPAGQRLFGVQDYKGEKCYKILHGKNAPCDFCTNDVISKDSFYIWENQNEYCGRHFLLKDRIVQYRGIPTRMEVALDVTKQEYVSQNARERLFFAEKIADYLDTLSRHADFEKAVNQVLASVGDFYQADRAYLFEPAPEHDGHWNNTFEWCAQGVVPQRDALQRVPPQAVSRWMEIFKKEQSVIILNLAPLQQASPHEWAVLERQNIQRLIVAPLRENGITIGFIGVDNPRTCIHDDTHVRVLASFLLARIRQDRNEHRYQVLLQHSNEDLLQSLQVGFWSIRRDQGKASRMIVNDTMEKVLEFEQSDTPVQRYSYWYDRIPEEERKTVDRALEQMRTAGTVVQVCFPWNHPRLGRVTLRFSGLVLEDGEQYCKWKGYCRLVD